MPSTVLDSDIFKDMFGSAEMRAVFSDDNLLKCCVDAEVALAVAQGRLGVIPQEAADAIAKLAPSVAIDRAALKHVRRERRLSDPRAGAATLAKTRRSRPLRALGRDHAGHRGHRHGAANPRGARYRRT